ncbi:hypothetical protein VNO80_06748 [Phaseolus coccineus]|uniref:Uncharacterized protein n=1 Tax=Phaseolus coccineus TaxID=3886 RepID=A0AAN9NMS7_PHACN
MGRSSFLFHFPVSKIAIIKEVLLSAFVRVKSMGKRPPPARYLPQTTSQISFSIMKPPFSLSNKGLLEVRALSPDELPPAARGKTTFLRKLRCIQKTNTLETMGPYGATPLRSEAIPARTNWVFALTSKDNIRMFFVELTGFSSDNGNRKVNRHPSVGGGDEYR